MKQQRDVFLCHASEEKPTVVRPLVAALRKHAITYWYDEAEIRWGDSITQKVNEGLRMSRYVIVVFSGAFLSKQWPQRELNAALNQEASSGEVRVLPLLVGSEDDRRAILNAYPILNDKLFLPWDAEADTVVKALKERLDENRGPQAQDATEEEARSTRSIPMPRSQKKFTQRDRDRFLRKAFGEVQGYFKEAVRILNDSSSEIEADLDQIHQYKFACSFYVNGELTTRCKVWLGSPFSTQCIVYSESPQLDLNADSSFSDWLTVVQRDDELRLEASNQGFGTPADEADTRMTTEKAAEYLWVRATDVLNRG